MSTPSTYNLWTLPLYVINICLKFPKKPLFIENIIFVATADAAKLKLPPIINADGVPFNDGWIIDCVVVTSLNLIFISTLQLELGK